MVFQHRKINNRSAPSPSRESGRSSSARLLWEFSKHRAICEVSHACCCGVCPSRSLSPPAPPLPPPPSNSSTPPPLCSSYPPPPPIFSLSLSPPVFLTHPLSLRLPRPTPSSLLLLSRRIVALVGREEKGISRVLEFWWEFVEDGACCDRVSLNFGAGGGEQSCL